MRYDIDTVLPISGGLDSAVLLYKLLNENKTVRTIFLDFGKPVTDLERSSAKNVTLRRNVPLEQIDLRSINTMQIGYIPKEVIDTRELDVKGTLQPVPDIPLGTSDYPIMGRADGVIISGFHTILSVSALNAQIVGAGRIDVAIIQEQTASQPDLLEAIKLFGEHISKLNGKAGTFKVVTPLSGMKKSDVIALGSKLGVPFEATYSCIIGEFTHCGKCSQCVSRRKGFKDAGIEDPTNYSA